MMSLNVAYKPFSILLQYYNPYIIDTCVIKLVFNTRAIMTYHYVAYQYAFCRLKRLRQTLDNSLILKTALAVNTLM